jgi:trigger factor
VEKRYGDRVSQEVVEDVLQKSIAEALTQEKLRPANQPSLEPIQLGADQDLVYQATFEVYPEVKLTPFSEMKITKPTCAVTEADLDKMVESLRRQHITWKTVDRPAGQGDQVDIDFSGSVDGEAFEGGQGNGLKIELGKAGLIAGFEDGLVGLAAGGETTLNLQFPEQYQKQELAGKPVQFAVKINSISEAELPEVNEEFIKSLGIADASLDNLRTEVKKQMEHERNHQIDSIVKRNILDTLFKVNPIDLPRSLVEREIQSLHHENHPHQHTEHCEHAHAPVDNHMLETYEKSASWRVGVGILLGEVIRLAEIKAEPKKVLSTIQDIASSYNNPSGIVKWYYEDAARLEGIKSLVLENAAVDWILERAEVTERPVSFDDLMDVKSAGVEAA